LSEDLLEVLDSVAPRESETSLRTKAAAFRCLQEVRVLECCLGFPHHTPCVLAVLRGQIVFDWVRQIAGEAGDDAGGLLVPFGSASVNVGDKNSDIDVVVIVTDDVTVDDFFVDFDGGANGFCAACLSTTRNRLKLAYRSLLTLQSRRRRCESRGHSTLAVKRVPCCQHSW
jgi:hypothetical protein